jgi:electron transport complex protein RnfB
LVTEAKTKPTLKRPPKFLAVIDEDGCTGCGICIEFCPVDCIIYVDGPEFPRLNAACRVVDKDCIGCKLCAKECPWDAIVMIDLRGKPSETQQI